MKKFCSTCGNQLELSQRLCTKCGTVNPFFVSSFSFLSEQPDLADQSEELEKLKLEKERIEKELADKEEKQKEFINQEKLKREAEEAEKHHLEKLEKEKHIKEQLELDKEQMNLKKEIIKRVKEEAELYKQETIDLVKGVKEELHQIEEDNKRLKEEMATLSKLNAQDRKDFATVTTQPKEKNTKEKRLVVSLLVILIGLTTVLAFVFFTKQRNNIEQTQTPVETKTEVMLQPEIKEDVAQDSVTAMDTTVVAVDTTPVRAKEPENKLITKAEPNPIKQAEAKTVAPTEEFKLTGAKIKKDMIGKRISGCDIIIGNSSEIEYVDNVTLVEKIASGNMKYKFTASIVQGGETYTASPYIYYSAQGAFIKIDGTNCE